MTTMWLKTAKQTIKKCLNISKGGNCQEGNGSLQNKGIKGKLKEDPEITEKQNEFFASVFTVEIIGQIAVPELIV